MNTYTTGQMIDILRENPTWEAIRDNGNENSRIRMDKKDGLAWVGCKERVWMGLTFISRTDWTIIKPESKPVSFMEAVNSWKRIKPKNYVIKGFENFESMNFWLFRMTESNTRAIDLINGQWLIEE